MSALSGPLVSYCQPSGTAKDIGPIVFTSAMARRGSRVMAVNTTPAVRALRAWLFGTARKTLREGRNRDDRVSRTRCPPRAVEDDAVERLAVLANDERAVQALRTRDRTEELAVGREDVHRLPGRDVHVALLIDGGSVTALAALQLAKLTLVRQCAIRVHVERVDDRAVRRVERLLVGA